MRTDALRLVFVLCIGDGMNSPHMNSLLSLYRLLLNLYPSAYRAEFGNEMLDTFAEGLEEAQSQGRWGIFLFREISDTPRVLAHAYWDGWRSKLETGIDILESVVSTSDLPPAPPDGRDSWRQVLFECSSFIFAGVFLILATYIRIHGLAEGWQRNIEFLGRIIVPLALPFLILALVRGLPRWGYPLMGLLLSYSGYISNGTSLWLLLIILLFASFTLTLAMILTDPNPAQLPFLFRRIGQSLSLDWTRLSFALYGSIPLIILMAFDDSHYNDRTPFLALSVLIMLVGALLYCRSRTEPAQLIALLGGITFSVAFAWLDQLSFANSQRNWIIVSSQTNVGSLWLFNLWLQWTFLLLSPAILVTLRQAIKQKEAMQ